MSLLHLSLVNAPSRFSIVKAMRQNHQTIIYDNKDFKIEQQRDSLGFVFLIYQGNTPVGTFRLVKTGRNNFTLAESIPNIEDLITIPGSWEIQRFYIIEDFRGLKNVMHIYRVIAAWLKNNTEIIHIIAICNRRVAALLQRTGLKVLAKDIKIGNAPSGYLLLGGAVGDISNKIL